MTWPLAIGHGPEGRGKPQVIRPLADNAAGRPAGQLFTSANDYARFCIAFMDDGKLDDPQWLHCVEEFLFTSWSYPYNYEQDVLERPPVVMNILQHARNLKSFQ